MTRLDTNNPVTVLMTKSEAEELATKLNIDSAFDTEHWEYKAEPKGCYFIVMAYDEEGNKLGHIN